jgi:hypothetical protein
LRRFVAVVEQAQCTSIAERYSDIRAVLIGNIRALVERPPAEQAPLAHLEAALHLSGHEPTASPEEWREVQLAVVDLRTMNHACHHPQAVPKLRSDDDTENCPHGHDGIRDTTHGRITELVEPPKWQVNSACQHHGWRQRQ